MPSRQHHVVVNSWDFPLVLPGTRNLSALNKEVLMCITAKIPI